jgi:hypothetical protein
MRIERLPIEDVKEILTRCKVIAVVGVSRDSSKDSYRVAEYLRKHGFHIIPVNPSADEILGKKTYKSLINIPKKIQKTLEIVDIFRPSAEVLPVVEQAVQLKESYDVPYVIWMQLGIVNEQAGEVARKAGLTVVMNKCMMQEHRKLLPEDKEKQ